MPRIVTGIEVVTCVAVLLLVQSRAEADFPARPRLSLDGRWQFRLDPQDQGHAARWYADETPFADAIMVPGNWQAQGYGEQNGIARHDYQGKAWYRRTFTVPATWQDKRIWLRFEGVCNWGEAYLDGVSIGRIDSFITPQELDVTARITSGQEHRLDVLVDSRTPPDAPYIGMMQFLVPWGGITSHVSLEARSDPQLERIRLRAEPGLKGVLADISIRRIEPGEAWQGRCQLRVFNADGSTAVEGEMSATIAQGELTSRLAEARIAFPDLRPWTPDDPQLYHVAVCLHDAHGQCDATTVRTGFRTLVVDPGSGNFLLNGQPLFLRGCGYDSLEPIYGTPPPDKAVYVDRLRHLKSYGFNAIRFLAHTPLDEFFDAADEVGLLLQTEGEWFLAGTPMQPGTAAVLQAQVPRMIREFEHHPSWYSFSCFNEAFNAHLDPVKQAYINSAYRTFRDLTPEHLFVASDGGSDQWPTDIITDRWVMGRADSPTDGHGPQQVFRGQVAEVALFHRVLEASDIKQLAGDPWDPHRSDEVLSAQPTGPLKPEAYWPQRVSPPGISLSEQADKVLPAAGHALTISVWVRPDEFALGDWGTFFSCGAAETGRALLLSLDGQVGDGRLQIGRFWNNILRSHQALAAGRWNHVALTYDGNRIRLWIDGVPDAEVDTTLDLLPVDIAIGRLVDRAVRSSRDYASRPHIWHEFDNTYIAPLPDLDKEQRLTGAMTQAWVLEPHRRRLESYGLLPRYAELRQRSIARYRESVKSVFERARHLPRLDGYSWWVVSDIPGGVETDVTDYGILDMLYQPEKFPDPAWFRQFNRESVLLIDADTDQRVLAAGGKKEIRLLLSHFGPAPIDNGELTWTVSDDARTLASGRIDGVSANVASIREIGRIALGPFEFNSPQTISLAVELQATRCRQNNLWQFWVFPHRKADLPSSGVVNLTGDPLLDTRYNTSDSRELQGAQVALATTVTAQLLSWVQAGGCAVLLEQNQEASQVTLPGVGAGEAPSRIVREPGTITYWPLWLRCDAQWVEQHPALGDFPHDGTSGFQFMRLFSSAVPTIDFTPRDAMARKHVQPIVAGLSLIPWNEDASRFQFALAYGTMLSEFRLGKGRVLVCNLWALDGVRRGFPEAGYLLDCLVTYAAADASSAELPGLSLAEAGDLLRITPESGSGDGTDPTLPHAAR